MNRTQYERIVDHIRQAGHITNRQAILEYSIQSLTRRITDLEVKGFRFNREEAHHPVTGQRYTRYKFADGSPRSFSELKLARGSHAGAA